MPRYFFHLLDPRQRVNDTQGEVLSGLGEAAQVGRQTAYELSRNVDPSTLAGVSIGVFDDKGNLLFEFGLADPSDREANGIRPIMRIVGETARKEALPAGGIEPRLSACQLSPRTPA